MAQVQKIAILGGGTGSLSAAFYLSARPDWAERYEITVYQQGWRLGGKGASGRNARLGQRIEEHGLHIWFGFYANAFATIRAVYQELARAPGAPLAAWDQAFRPQDSISLAEAVGAEWRPWNLLLPRRPGEPGLGSDPVTPWRMALEALTWLRRWRSDLAALAPAAPDAIDALLATARALPLDARDHTPADQARLRDALDRASACARPSARMSANPRANADATEADRIRRAAIGLEVWLTALRGMLADGVFTRGFDAVNGEDLRAWLARHGGDPALCLDSAPVHAMYSQLFAFEDGDPARPNLEAGTALRWIMRMSFAYRGGVMYRMQAGMGDAVFAPLYQVLAALLQAYAVDLESWWSDWPARYREAFGAELPRRTLQRGRDFDLVVLGLPVATLPLVAPGLLAASAPLRASATALRTVPTQACQVWLERSTLDTGWTFAPEGEEPILTNFGMPYDTWAAMSQVLPSEAWAAPAPSSVQYFCGAMALPGISSLPPQSDSGFPARAASLAKANALDLLGQRIAALWPAADGGFPWQWLVDPEGGTGPARFERQYWRANVDPSERYVLSVAGSSASRLATTGAGLPNLFLAGDWLRTGMDCGCVEAAVMGGMQASRAISGYPQAVVGDSDLG